MPQTARRRRAEGRGRSRRRAGRALDAADAARVDAGLRPPAYVDDLDDPDEPGSGSGPVHVEVVPPATSATVAEATVVVPDPADARRSRRLVVAVWSVLLALGTAALVAALADTGPGWLDGVGATLVVTTYTWALAARTGGRPVVFGALALALAVTVLALDQDALRTGAAVLTCVVSAVLGVMVTRPAVRWIGAARECVVAVLVAGVGALATIGFAPVVSVARFEYATLGLAVVGAFGVVYRLGAGLHGLGRRGLVAVLAGGVLLAVTLLYAELLRHYGPPAAVDHLLDGVRWVRHRLGAFPRPIETVLGVPALAWGCQMRTRRRQGWWLCAFGVAATAPVANALVNPAISLRECGLSVLYGLVVGLVLAYVVIRADLAITRPHAQGGRRLEEAAGVRPEPSRTEPLL